MEHCSQWTWQVRGELSVGVIVPSWTIPHSRLSHAVGVARVWQVRYEDLVRDSNSWKRLVGSLDEKVLKVIYNEEGDDDEDGDGMGKGKGKGKGEGEGEGEGKGEGDGDGEGGGGGSGSGGTPGEE